MPKIAATSLALISSETEPGGIRDMWELILGVVTVDAEAWNAVAVGETIHTGCAQTLQTRLLRRRERIVAVTATPVGEHAAPDAHRTRCGRLADGGFTRCPRRRLRRGWSFLSSSAVRANEAREMVPALCEGVLYSVLKLAPLTDHAEECATRVCVDDVVGVWMREFGRGNRRACRALDVMRDALDVMATKPHAKTAVIEAWSALGDITERAHTTRPRANTRSPCFRSRRLGATASASRVRRAPVRQGCLRARRSPPDDAFGRSPRRARGRAGCGRVRRRATSDGFLSVRTALDAPAPPSRVLKHDATRWRAVIDRALSDDDDEECVYTVVDALRATTTPSSLACDALDALARGAAAAHRHPRSSAEFLRVVCRRGLTAVLSRDAAIDAYEMMATGARDASARRALATRPPPREERDVVARGGWRRQRRSATPFVRVKPRWSA